MKTLKLCVVVAFAIFSISVCAQNAIDLGLSVKWADRNVGASSAFDYGTLYGWGDVNGSQKLQNLNKYPTSTPPKNICGTQYDIARAQWGGKWRMPTIEEIAELRNKCTVKFITTNDNMSGFLLTGPNGNSIFFPLAGIRKGSLVTNRNKVGYYWSGTLGNGDNRAAEAFYLYNNCEIEQCFFRYYGFSVRPVLDN